MSEYQYYEFRAIDQPLTKPEMAELRRLSTRAEITPRSFVNVYHYGDFRGEPLELMKRYFDVFVYVANWGTRWLMVRLPRSLLDPDAVAPYCVEDCVDAHAAGDFTVLELRCEEQEPEWVEDAEEWMPSLLPLRADLADGDLRALYLGWLRCVQGASPEGDEDRLEDEDYRDDEEDDSWEDEPAGLIAGDEIEPPVPPGLGRLSEPLEALVEFLRIDRDLIAVAAAASGPMREFRPSAAELGRWIGGLPDADKNALLLRLAEGGGTQAQAELLRRFRESRPATRARADDASRRRTVAELQRAAQARALERRRAEAARAAEERARRARDEAAARAAYLDRMAGREEELWHRIEELVEVKRAAEYDQAVRFVIDLRDLSARDQTRTAFDRRLNELRARHAKKPSLLRRLDEAGLTESARPA